MLNPRDPGRAVWQYPLGDIDDQFLEQLRSLLLEQNTLLDILRPRDDDARYSAMARDSASSRQHVTQFTLRPGDRASYDGQEYTLLSIGDSTPTTPAKAIVRLVSHEHVATRTVRYASLRPRASPCPEHMNSSVTCDSLEVGQFVFFASDTMSSTDVLGPGGMVTQCHEGPATNSGHINPPRHIPDFEKSQLFYLRPDLPHY